MGDYIEKVKAALNAAGVLSAAIAAETAKHKDSCVITDEGLVGATLEELRSTLKALRQADNDLEKAA